MAGAVALKSVTVLNNVHASNRASAVSCFWNGWTSILDTLIYTGFNAFSKIVFIVGGAKCCSEFRGI